MRSAVASMRSPMRSAMRVSLVARFHRLSDFSARDSSDRVRTRLDLPCLLPISLGTEIESNDCPAHSGSSNFRELPNSEKDSCSPLPPDRSEVSSSVRDSCARTLPISEISSFVRDSCSPRPNSHSTQHPPSPLCTKITETPLAATPPPPAQTPPVATPTPGPASRYPIPPPAH